MAQTKILVDSNSYFRLALNLHPLLCTPFGKEDFTLYIHKDLRAEFDANSRLQNKFHWVADEEFVKNRSRSINVSKRQKVEIEETLDFMWEHVKEAFHQKRGKGPSKIDTKILATAAVLNIRVVTDDQDMIEVAKEYGIHQISSLELMKLMLDEGHILREKVEQIVEHWQYENDTPYRGWQSEYKKLFGKDPPPA